eukprot:2784771-Prymnesium_polylepis.1
MAPGEPGYIGTGKPGDPGYIPRFGEKRGMGGGGPDRTPGGGGRAKSREWKAPEPDRRWAGAGVRGADKR